MPLASTFALQFYGPGMAGGVVSTVAAEQSLDARGTGRMAVENLPDPAEHLGLVATRTMGVANTVAPTQSLAMKGFGRMAVTSKVNELTQDDVTGAVLTAEVAPGLTLRQALVDARQAAKLAAALSA